MPKKDKSEETSPAPKKRRGRPRKWTKERALELGNALIAWIEADPDNIFWEQFLYMEWKKDKLYPEIISYLSGQYDEFLQLIKRAKKLQEYRLLNKGLSNPATSSVVIFTAKNHHGYADKVETKSEQRVTQTSESDLTQLSDEQLRRLVQDLVRKSDN